MPGTHGPQHDNFTAQSVDPHGPEHDVFTSRADSYRAAHGKLHDVFTRTNTAQASKHGAQWDEFGWEAMPGKHGQQFDSDFGTHTAHTGQHGTWHDVFRGGTQVRFMAEGADYEGVVIDVNSDFATVRDRSGQVREVGLGQFLAYRTPGDAQVGPSTPASEAHAPSARDPEASGGRLNSNRRTPSWEQATRVVANKSLSWDVTDVEKVAGLRDGGVYHCSGCPKGQRATFVHYKSTGKLERVNKNGNGDGQHWHGKDCPNCGTAITNATLKTRAEITDVHKGAGGEAIHDEWARNQVEPEATDEHLYHCPRCHDMATDKPPEGKCPTCGTDMKPGKGKAVANMENRQSVKPNMTPVQRLRKAFSALEDIAKSVDTAETAVQGKDEEAVSGNAFCPTCQHYCRKVQGGKCPTCGSKVTAAKADKSATDDVDVAKWDAPKGNAGAVAHMNFTGQTSHKSGMGSGILCKDCHTAAQKSLGSPHGSNPIHPTHAHGMSCDHCQRTFNGKAWEGEKAPAPKLLSNTEQNERAIAAHNARGFGKATTGDLGIKVPTRDHRATDRAGEPERHRCPHCGGQLDAATESGMPNRHQREGHTQHHPGTHKCWQGAVADIAKTLETR